jgi:hypothetical protein
MKQYLPLSAANKLVLALALAAPLSACDAFFGKEVARLPINEVSTSGREVVKEASLQLKKGEEVSLWSDMDLAYEGEAPVRFLVLVAKDGAPFKQLEIDPTEKNVSVGEIKTQINSKVEWSFSGKNAELTAPEAGTYTFKAKLVAAPNASLKVTKAELVLKK